MQISDLAIKYSIDGSSPITVRLIQSRTVVGASSQADIRIESPFMSRQHFMIEQQGDRLYVTELGSSNGTLLQGRRLPANTRQEWLPGQTLSVANIRFELVTPQGAATESTVTTGGLLTLIADPAEVSAGQPSRLTLNYQGSTPQMIYLRSDTKTDGLDVSISPDQVYVQPGQAVFADVTPRKTKAYWTGGKFSVALVALTHNGEDSLTELIVNVRPRYELLLLFLLLLFAGGLGAAVALPQFAAQIAPTNTPTLTVTASPTATATATLTATASPTITPTVTHTPSNTPTPTVTPTPTFPTSTLIPSRTPTNTPTNTIQPPIIITSPPLVITVIVPPIITPVTPVTPITPGFPNDPQTACAGFVGRSPLQSLPNGTATFSWDAPASGGAVSYVLTISNLDSGQSTTVTTGFEVTSTAVDVSDRAMGRGSRFSWQVTAQLIDGRTCIAPAISLLRETPPDREPLDDVSRDEDCLPGAPCPDGDDDVFRELQASSLVPDLTMLMRGSADAYTLEKISNAVMLLMGMAVLIYKTRRRRPYAGLLSVDENER